MILLFLLWNVVLCNEATELLPSEGFSLSERDDDNISNPNSVPSSNCNKTHQIKKKRNKPGNPDPNAEVIALPPETLLATNRFVCEICQKGFQREQNLQLHRRGHNLPWILKQRNSSENRKKVYTCPEPTCVHHHPSRALGDLTGIKKHFSRKHGEKRWRCEKCSKIYAVQSDWKAHSKTCGTREYQCDCGITFSRKDAFTTHRPFCSLLAQESTRISATTFTGHHAPLPPPPSQHQILPPLFSFPPPPHHHHHHFFSPNSNPMCYLSIQNPKPMWEPLATNPSSLHINPETFPPFDYSPPFSSHFSATALLQKAASVGSSMAGMSSHFVGRFGQKKLAMWHKDDHLTRDFLGLTREDCGDANVGLKELLTFSDEHDLVEMKVQARDGFGFGADQTWK